MEKQKCKYCNKEIIWRKNKNGKSVAFEASQVPCILDNANGHKWAWIDDEDMIRMVRTCSESYEKEQYFYGYLSHNCNR